MRQSRAAAAELDGEASHQSDGLAPTSKRRMQRRSPKPADAELTLLELCVCPLSYLPRRSAELYGHLTRRTVVVGVEAAVRPVSASADSRPVVARLDLTAGRPLGLRDAVLPPPVHLIAVVKRGGGNGRGGAIGRSAGNGGRRSGRRECEHSCDKYRNESLLHGPPITALPASASLPSVGKESTGAPTEGLEPVLVTGHWRSLAAGT